jgi:Ran-binding protein 3
MTGEEEEETVYQVRGKLFILANGNTWQEKGTGLLKLNVRAVDGAGARLGLHKFSIFVIALIVG